jgi:hypothetical protein
MSFTSGADDHNEARSSPDPEEASFLTIPESLEAPFLIGEGITPLKIWSRRLASLEVSSSSSSSFFPASLSQASSSFLS